MQKSKTMVIAGLLVMELLAAIDTTGVTVMVPTLQQYFKIPPQIAGWILMAYLIPFSLFLVPMGYLADKIGKPEKVITWSILTFAICSALCGLAVNEYMLIAFRIIKGIAAAGMFACEFAIILKYWEEPRRIVEIVITGLALGVLIGPIFGGLFSHAQTWRYFFIIGTVLSLAGFIAYQWIKKLEPVVREADQSEFAQCQTFGQKTKILFVLLFWGMLLDFIISVSTQGANLLITLQVQEVIKKSPLYNSAILAVLALGMILANALGIGSKFFKNTKTAVLASGSLFALILILLVLATNWTGISAFICYFLMGLALGIFISTIELMVLNPLPTSMLAQGNGWIVTSMQAGYGLGSFLAPLLFLHLGATKTGLFLSLIVFVVVIPFLLFQKKSK